MSARSVRRRRYLKIRLGLRRVDIEPRFQLMLPRSKLQPLLGKLLGIVAAHLFHERELLFERRARRLFAASAEAVGHGGRAGGIAEMILELLMGEIGVGRIGLLPSDFDELPE